MTHKTFKAVIFCLMAAAVLTPQWVTAQTAQASINVYSARHYPTDEALYADFTKSTGIKINRLILMPVLLVKSAYKASSVG